MAISRINLYNARLFIVKITVKGEHVMSRRGESIYKRADGRWEARYIHHYEDGRAKYRFLYAKSYSEVKAKRLEEQQKTKSVYLSKPTGTATFQEISLLWLDNIRDSVKESTYARYHRLVNAYILPTLSDKRIVKLDSQYLKSFSSTLLACGGKGQTPLSIKTVRDVFYILNRILAYGEENGYPCSPAKRIDLPHQANRETKIIQRKSMNIIEQAIINSEVTDKDSRVKLGILFTLYTGLRIGELCGIRYSDIDFVNETILIQRTVERISNLDSSAKSKTKIIISEPKTNSGKRIIPLPHFLAQYLKEYPHESNTYLLTGTTRHTEPHQFYLRYKTFMKNLGMAGYTFHALRHTFATRCIESGFDPKSLSEILGHSSVKTTLAIYVHPTLEQKRQQMELLTPFFRS